MSALHQMNMSYVAEEDRILFRLSTKDKKKGADIDKEFSL